MSTNDTSDAGFARRYLTPATFSLGGGIVVLLALAYFAFEWGVNRIYVPEGKSLMLRYKGPPLAYLPGYRTESARGRFAEVNPDNPTGWPQELGVMEEMVGPGRHFYSPFWWERTLVDDKIVEPGQVGIASSKLGNELPQGQFLVDGDLGETEFKGIVRKVFGPGRYRVNPYGYEFEVVDTVRLDSGGQEKQAGWVEIPTGHVGVVTNLADNPATGATPGIQDKVLPPGIYPINPREQHVDVVEIGYREKSIIAELKQTPAGDVVLDENGEPMVADSDSGITFPSNDGFNIQMDFTAIWGIMPDQAAAVVRKFGNVQAVEDKVITPQIESICRNQGSRRGAVDLLVGETRQEFQETTSAAFEEVLKDKDVTLRYGLVRHIYIPQEVRLPIQEQYVADEEKLTSEEKQRTKETEGELREAEETVKLEGERVRVETTKLVAEALAEGQKTAAETAAETEQLVAAVDREVADLEAQATVLRGEATASAKKMLQEAQAGKFKLAVEAFGSGTAYNQWVFASGLPDDIQLDLLYAGEGTFWTDLKGFTETMLGRQVQRESESRHSTQASPKR